MNRVYKFLYPISFHYETCQTVLSIDYAVHVALSHAFDIWKVVMDCSHQIGSNLPLHVCLAISFTIDEGKGSLVRPYRPCTAYSWHDLACLTGFWFSRR